MDNQSHPGKSPAELAVEVYNILLPHPSDIRLKAVQAAMASLGESIPQQRGNGGSLSGAGAEAEDFADVKLGPRALRWVQRFGVTRAMLDEVFHLADNRVEISASDVPGGSKREMTVNCYLLTGLRGLLATDVSSIDDSDAIAVCKRLTAYDKNNHTTNRNAVGNKMSGTKPNFVLTGPGETAAAELIKKMTATRNG